MTFHPIQLILCVYCAFNYEAMSLQVYGIPNCGTCKKAFSWLESNGVEYAFINTKEQPPSKAMIQEWVQELGFKPMRNTSGQSYRALGSEKDDWTEAQWVEAFTKDAMLLKRPLFVKDGKAVLVGFRDKDEVIRQKLGV
ncbi:MAG: arsenate reductase family protein [Leptolyngbyaceae cyanobacterium]